MKVVAAIFGTILVVALFVGLDFAGSLYGWWKYSFFAPKMEAVRRDTMIQSRAYTEGETRNLYKYKIEFEKAPVGSPERATVLAAAQHECEAFDIRRLPTELAAFCNPAE